MDRIEDCISFLTGKAMQQVTRRAKEKLGVHGVTPVQYAVLKLLWGTDGLKASDLVQRLRLDSATITGVVDRLERDGLIARRADAEDRRVQRLFLTETGAALQTPLDGLMDDLNGEADRTLGADAAALKGALARLGDPANWPKGT